MPPTFEGAKLSVTKILSSHFQVTHSLALNSGASCGYKFGANYVGTQIYSPADVNVFCRICLVNEILFSCRYPLLFLVIWMRMGTQMHRLFINGRINYECDY